MLIPLLQRFDLPMADLSFADNWDFSPGEGFAREVKNRFSSTVHFSPGFSDVRPFKLVVCFSRFNFRLSEESVALALCC